MIPQRTCIGCRRRDAQNAMLRLVRRDELIVPASNPRLSGRGAYLHRDCLELAVKRQAFKRAFGPAAQPDPRLWSAD